MLHTAGRQEYPVRPSGGIREMVFCGGFGVLKSVVAQKKMGVPLLGKEKECAPLWWNVYVPETKKAAMA